MWDQRDMYMNRMEPSKTYLLALALWCDYFTRTELYDRRVCSVFKADGTAIPMNGWEFQAINDYAHSVRKEINRDAQVYGISADEWAAAKKEALLMDFDHQATHAAMVGMRIKAIGTDTTEK